MDKRYEYMLDMEYKGPKGHKHMPVSERAAQFGAFRALTGYEDAIYETGRLVDEKIELGELQKEELDRDLREILERAGERPEAELTYFVPDSRKQGGEYVTVRGRVKGFDEEKNCLLLMDRSVFVGDILQIKGL